MESKFIRTLWGEYDSSDKNKLRRKKMENDIRLLLRNPNKVDFKTYVFGEDNLKFLIDQGIEDCELIDKKPIVWDMGTQQFRHKIEAFKIGIEEFDEIVFLDWDCQAIKPIPIDFWDVLRKKEKIQAIMRMYKRRKAYWRKEDQRKIPCASFVYINDKDVGKDLVEMWNKMKKPWSEEIVMMRYMEEINGGWKGIEDYWEKFEPDFFVLDEGYIYSKELLKTKNLTFKHYNSNQVKRKLRHG